MTLVGFGRPDRFCNTTGAQAFNLFNHAQFVGGFLKDVTPFGTAAISRAFLVPSSPFFGAYNQGTPQVRFFPSNARQLQLVARFLAALFGPLPAYGEDVSYRRRFRRDSCPADITQIESCVASTREITRCQYAGSASYNRQLAMQQMLEAMETALRVLAALNEKRHPDPADVDALRVYAGPQPEIRALDELACEVIQTVLRPSAR